MKKFKWLIVGFAVLVATTVVVLNVSGDPNRVMNSSECLDDGSCCQDENTCGCGS